MKNFFIPNATNNYSPYLLRQKALIFYFVFILIVNFTFTDLFYVKAKASVDFSTLYNLHNQERQKRGLSELSINTDLNASATLKAKAMLASDCWSHYCPNGKSPWDYFDEVGYTYVYAGENLAEGFNDNEDVMNAWMNSPTHRDNILNSHFEEIGIGFAYGDYQGIKDNIIIVVHFGSKHLENPNAKTASVNGSVTPTPSPLVAVEITSPKDGSQLNDPQFPINGTAPENSLVTILANSKELGKVAASGNNFAFRPPVKLTDNTYSITAEAFSKQGNILGTANPVKVNVDTTVPVIQVDTLVVNAISLSRDKLTFKIQANEPLSSLTANLGSYKSEKIAETTWQMEVNRVDLEAITNLTLTAKDLADNEAKYEIPSASVLGQADRLEKSLLAPADNSFLGGVQNILPNIFPQDTRSQINLIFLFFLSILFVIDFYVLSRSGLTGMVRSRSHYHLPMFILLILLIVIGGSAGNILTGTFR